MSNTAVAPLGAPPRKVHFRRAIRNLVRAYRTIFTLIILVVGGWAALDLFRWRELDTYARVLTVIQFAAVAIAILVLRFVERPLLRELRLARRGVVVIGEIVSVTLSKRRRAFTQLTYRYRVEGVAEPIVVTCRLPKRIRPESLTPGTAIEVLHDPAKSRVSKPRLAMDFVEFTPAAAK